MYNLSMHYLARLTDRARQNTALGPTVRSLGLTAHDGYSYLIISQASFTARTLSSAGVGIDTLHRLANSAQGPPV